MTGTEADRQRRATGRLSRWLLLALFLTAVAVVIQTIAPQTIGEQARRHLQQTLSEHYPQYDVTVGRGSYSPSVGVIFEDLVIADPSSQSDSTSWGFTTRKPREVLTVKRLTIVADTDAKLLLEKKNPLVTRRIVAEGVAAQTWLTAEGDLSIARLWPLPKMGPAAPKIEVRGANVRLIDLTGYAPPVEIDLSEISLVNRPASSATTRVASNATHTQNQTHPSAPNTTASEQTVASQRISLRGTSNLFNSIELKAQGSQNGLVVEGQIRNARISPQLIDCLPAAYRAPLQQARGLNCLCDISLNLQHRPTSAPAQTQTPRTHGYSSPSTTDHSIAHQSATGKLTATSSSTDPTRPSTDYQLSVSIRQGRFEHTALPRPITNLTGLVVCRPSGLSLQGFQGLCGTAVCRIVDGAIDKYQWPEAASFNASISGLNLDQGLANSIPPTMRQGWENLQPTGQIDIVDANLFFQNGRWMTNATVDCKGVDVQYAKFPYPVQQLVGRITIRDSIAYAKSISGRINGQRLECAFRLPTDPRITPERFFAIATEGPIAIDGTLLRSLSHRGAPASKLETFVRSLNPRGSVHLTKAEFRTDVDGQRHRDVELQITDAHLRYSQFAYPLYSVSGNIKVVDDDVTLRRFEGANANAGQIFCDGTYRIPQPRAADFSGQKRPSSAKLKPFTPEGLPIAQAPRLRLEFNAKNTPMDEALRASLPPSAQNTWDAISPSGVLDQLSVVVTQQDTGMPIGLNVTGTEIESVHTDNRTLSIQPPSLPYRLDISDAVVNYDGNRVRIDSLQTRHGGTRLSARGSCDQQPDGRWRLSLGIDSGSRIAPDSELIDALPTQVQHAMYQLQLQRPVSIRGPVSLLLADTAHPQPIIDWDVVLQLEGNRIGDVGPVHDLRGELSSVGTYDARGVRAKGNVRIDSIHIDDLQVTAIQGPYSIADERLKLGIDSKTIQPTSQTSIPVAKNVSPDNRKIRGRLFGGEVELAGDVVLTTGGFNVALALNNGRVPELLAELGKGRSELTGMVNGQANVEGILGTTDLLKGKGSARVFGANLYQLPLLVQLLNLLRIKATEDVAFTDADVEFSLMEDTITFDDLKLWGDLVALQGGGTLDRRRELDLTFNTQVSPHNAVTHILRPLRKQNYTLWTVDVRGPMDAPSVHRSSRDGVGQTLERFLPGVTGRESPSERISSPATEGRFSGKNGFFR